MQESQHLISPLSSVPPDGKGRLSISPLSSVPPTNGKGSNVPLPDPSADLAPSGVEATDSDTCGGSVRPIGTGVEVGTNKDGETPLGAGKDVRLLPVSVAAEETTGLGGVAMQDAHTTPKTTELREELADCSGVVEAASPPAAVDVSPAIEGSSRPSVSPAISPTAGERQESVSLEELGTATSPLAETPTEAAKLLEEVPNGAATEGVESVVSNAVGGKVSEVKEESVPVEPEADGAREAASVSPSVAVMEMQTGKQRQDEMEKLKKVDNAMIV